MPPTSDKLGIDSYDFGTKTGLSYNLTNKFAIEATYYYGLNNIFENNSVDWIWKVEQVTVGLRYKFFTTRQKSEMNNSAAELRGIKRSIYFRSRTAGY